MTEMMEKKGKLKLTIEVEVNEQLMDLAKNAMEKMPMRMQEMWKMHGRKERISTPNLKCPFLIFFFDFFKIFKLYQFFIF